MLTIRYQFSYDTVIELTVMQELKVINNDPDLPILTPATFLFQQTMHLPEDQTWRTPDKDLRR
ncbi:hypothetical protein pdam_00024602 [Pocillopora damicornis]|uniref:Uncharacterized protein n=1 Tax=Pocillopora damicornis TaxID=46731 RepID=A0A3M6TWV4_POCDA|nr:hypothetical protein pdam_00024602 [Pocillopora damicornis]